MDGQALFADKNAEVKEKVDISEEQQNIVQEILKGEREILLELEEIKKREKRNNLGNSANIFSGKAALLEQERNQRLIMIEMATNNNNAKQAQQLKSAEKSKSPNHALETPLLPPKKEDHIFTKMKQPSMFGKKTAIQNKK